MVVQRVLVLCAANRCRSPLFAVMLREQLQSANVEVTVESAGFQTSRRPAEPGSVREAAARGLDLSTHLSRRVEATDLRRADLVLTMELAQLREAVSLDARCWPRTFTLRDLVRRAGSATAAADGDRVAGVHAGRRAGDLLRAGPVDDVPDPVGGPPAAFAAMASEFDRSAPVVAELLTG